MLTIFVKQAGKCVLISTFHGDFVGNLVVDFPCIVSDGIIILPGAKVYSNGYFGAALLTYVPEHDKKPERITQGFTFIPMGMVRFITDDAELFPKEPAES